MSWIDRLYGKLAAGSESELRAALVEAFARIVVLEEQLASSTQRKQ